ESSCRFARGTAIGALDLALDRAATLIDELAGGEVSTITDIYPLPVQTREIEVTFEKINSIIGVNIEQSFVENTLISLGLDTRRKIDTSRSLEDTLIIIPPSFRNDIQTDIDIVEEVARLYGYDNIPSTLPSVHMSPAPEHELYKQIKTMKNSMVMSGFYEAVNFSFMNPNMLDQLLLRKEDHRRSFISIKNPLRQEDSAMRTTLVPTLLQNLSLNLNRGEKMLRFFEVARTYTDTGDKLPVERTELTAILHKDKSAALWEARNVGYYDLKGVLENLLRVINLHGVEFVPSCDKTEPYLHPGKTAIIRVNDENIGTIGVLHPGVAVAFDLKGDITVAEIWDLNKLLEYTAAIPEYRTIPRFPYIERDIALVVSDSVTAADVKREVLTSGSDIIESVSLFDIYKGKPLPADKKSLAFAVRYRSTSDTLKDSDVEEVHGSIISRLQKNLGAELRS
nr:phenylalanine--tRNA ligase subunit beta [bacterium]